MVFLVSLFSIAAALVAAAGFDDIQFPTDDAAVDRSSPSSSWLPRPDQSLDVSLPVDSHILDKHAAPCMITLVDNHTYAFSYDKPYQGTFDAASCYNDPDYSLVYVRYKANVDPGRQFDRLAAVWVGPHAILRTTTQEPNRVVGPHWEIFREISQYRSLFGTTGNVTASLDNVVNSVYTSHFYVTVTVEFYKKDPAHDVVQRVPSAPDQIIPVFKPHSTYPWFHVQPNTVGRNYNLVTFPKNVDGLYLELFTSHHGCDEFYYANPTDEVKAAVGADCAGGAFREVQVLLDDDIVGAVWPFPLIYTGGISPAMWRPIVAVGAFEAPTYIVDLTPFLANVLDGKPHNVSFAIGNGHDYWPTNGNLLVYVDHDVEATVATLDKRVFQRHVVPDVATTGHGANVTIHTTAERDVYVKATIANAQGIRTYSVKQKFAFVNQQVYSNNANDQTFNQRTTTLTTTTIKFDDGTKTTKYYMEDYPLSGETKYRSYVASKAAGRVDGMEGTADAVDIPPFRAPRIQDGEPMARGNTIMADYYKYNVSIQHDLRQKLRIDGNKDAFRLGVDEYELTIAQTARAQIDSRVGFNATTSVSLAASNWTGCYSHDVASSSGNYTKYYEGRKCPHLYVESVEEADEGDL
ncbi:hypothetical protein H310_10420 [Aphanomyces invadans]|uniref:Peptide N-acetyl-beta-D-glucosaminyl asparaginase amidase A N-terminal domain-containing protein n=1 Tax=Aphanomyces invadans TaxID=157072 RepID=A0A024TRH7_9STRA|nr:hypothetical protein H310_10420 [Aphanomyces invadans]ETV96236.1 hypothetical protein H310_10420 [Aphanomyces invadans]|eukprot:XP_008875028.1 hypothetical protein H310_10420 [Aphanomyces invadans]